MADPRSLLVPGSTGVKQFAREAAQRPLDYNILPGFSTPDMKRMKEVLGEPAVAWGGHTLGDTFALPANMTVPQPLMHYGSNDMKRYKVTISVRDAAGGDVARNGRGVRFFVHAQIQNERHPPRRCFVTIGDGRIVYAPGTSVKVEALNPENIPLEVSISLDESSHGFSDYWDVETFENISAGEHDLDVPPYCRAMVVLTDAAANPAIIRGYGTGGAAIYQETLAVPRSADIPRLPRMDYTLQASAGNPDYWVYYFCEG